MRGRSAPPSCRHHHHLDLPDDPEKVFQTLAARYHDADLDYLDGLTVGYPAWWFNIRRSHTEPVVRLNLEADTESLMEEKRQEVLGVIREIEVVVVPAGGRR